MNEVKKKKRERRELGEQAKSNCVGKRQGEKTGEDRGREKMDADVVRLNLLLHLCRD